MLKRYQEFIKAVEEGKAEIKTSTLYPYELVRALDSGEMEARTINVMWKNLPNYVEGDENAIVVADVSGSMAGLPIAGDDIKSQVGATIVHRTLAQLCMDRGVKLEKTYQLNIGGNTDFQNMLQSSEFQMKQDENQRANQESAAKVSKDYATGYCGSGWRHTDAGGRTGNCCGAGGCGARRV